MDSEPRSWTPGAWPARGTGPREGLRPGAVWPSRRDTTGGDGPTHWQCRSGRWRRTGHNLWVPAEVDASDPDQRIVEAAAQAPAYGAVTGWAGLRWRGATWFDGVGRGGELRPVDLALGAGQHRRLPGVRVSQESLMPWQLGHCDGLRVTDDVRSLAFEMRRARSDEDAVIAFEMAAFHDLVSVAELRDHVELLATWTGVERLRLVLPLLDENSWSPTESVMRLSWTVEGGYPRPLTNRPVFDLAGRFIATPDLLDPGMGVVGEYEGGVHLSGTARARDVGREAKLRRVGLEPVTMLSGDLADRGPFLRRVDDAYARAASRPASEAGWTLTPPPWWVETVTVDQRRALSAGQRRRLLGHRDRAA